MELNTCTRGEYVGNNDFFPCPPPPPCVAHISKKLFTYPSPKTTSRREVSVLVDLREGYLGSFPETYNELSCLCHVPPCACFCLPEKFPKILPVIMGCNSLQYTGTITVCLVTLWHKMRDTILIFSNSDQS